MSNRYGFTAAPTFAQGLLPTHRMSEDGMYAAARAALAGPPSIDSARV